MASGMKRARTREMGRAWAKDRLSDLPECLLSNEILPKISFRDAIRCSLLSRSWRFLWTKMPNLNFCCQDFENQKDHSIQIIIENALFNHHAPLHSFQLRIALTDSRSHSWVGNWVHLAALKHVKRITLEISERNATTGKKKPHRLLLLQLGDSVFECESLAALKVNCCFLPKIPTNFGGFQSLKSCYWFYVPGLNDEIFLRLMELCPNLQNLGVHACLHLKNLKINAANLRYLDVGFLMPGTSLEMVSPHLTEIKLQQYHLVQGLQLLKGVSRAESVKKITLLNYGGVNQKIPNFAVLERFPHLQELTIHGQCFQEMISVDKVPEGVTLQHLNKVQIHIEPEMDEREVSLLGFLLKNYPIISMRVFLPPRCSKIIQNKLLDLKKKFPEPNISFHKIRWIPKCQKICQICDVTTSEESA
ncbi:hypothetical protein KI387_025139, partial [Taxus chinensis]